MHADPPVHRVLFVCLGNICRSPAAEGVFQKLVENRGLRDQFVIDSAGTCSYHLGELADSRMRSAASERGYELTSRARALNRSDLKDFDLIVAMDRENFRQIHLLATHRAEHVHMLSDFLGPEWPRDVPDPYHGGIEGFGYVLDMLEAACPKILLSLTGK